MSEINLPPRNYENPIFNRGLTNVLFTTFLVNIKCVVLYKRMLDRLVNIRRIIGNILLIIFCSMVAECKHMLQVRQ
jgi:hypothetical protein